MATPTLRQTLGAFNSSGTASVTTTSSTAVGDLIVCVHETAFRPTSELVSPGGTSGTWTQVVTADQTTVKMRLWYRYATVAGAQTVSVTPGGSSNTNQIAVLTLTGTATSSPIDGTAGTSTGTTGTSHAIAATSPTTTDAMLFGAWGAYGTGVGSSNGYAAPGTMAQQVEVNGSANNALMVANQTLSASGSTGTRTATANASSSGWAGILFAVKGIASGPPTVGAGADVSNHVVNTAFTRTASESGSGITSRSWEITAGPTGVGTEIGTAAALNWTPTQTGSYTLEYSATNAQGTGSDSMTISVVTEPPPTVGAGADVGSHQVGTEFTRTASESGSGITARGWSIVSGPYGTGESLSTATALSWTPLVGGTWVLRYSATNAGGTNTDDMSITVLVPPEPPGEILNIGIGDGRNHFSVDIARSPSERELMECEQIEAGLDEPPFFTSADDNAKCGFWTQVNAATTSGSSYPRCELREVQPGGSTNMAWDPHDGGTHWIRGRSAATHLMAVKPTLIMAQQHSGDDDVIQIRTQLRSGAVHLEVVLNGATGSPITLVNPFTVDAEFDWMLEILPPINGQVAKGRIYYQSWLEPVHTWPVTDMPATTPGHYYKAGNYLNSNTSTESGNSSEYGSSTLRNLQHWHTGWAPADNGFWNLPTVDAGADISSPAGWAVSRLGLDTAQPTAERRWRVMDGPTGGTSVGQIVSTTDEAVWTPTVQGVYRLRYGVTVADVGTNYDDVMVTVTAPVAASGGGFLPFFDA